MERAKVHTLGMITTSKGNILCNCSLGNSFWYKKVFFYCWVGISCEYSRCNNIDQQFADARLSKTAQITLTLWLQEKIICMLNMKETCFEVFIWYKREFECFGNVFFSMTCKSRWSCDALLELKYAYINRSKNSEFK